MKALKKVAAACVLTLGAVGAHAASLSFVYTGDNDVDAFGNPIAALNDVLTFDLVMDFTDEATIGGIFDIAFDSSALEFVSYTPAAFGDPALSNAPNEIFDRLIDASFGDFDGLSGPAVFAQLSFKVIDSRFTNIVFVESTALSGGFISAVSFLDINDVDYGGIVVRTPLPAAAWLLLSACGALGFSARRRHT